MAEIRPMDPAFPIQQQLAVEAAPVVLVNSRFAGREMSPGEVPAALRVWLTAHAAPITLVLTATVLGLLASRR